MSVGSEQQTEALAGALSAHTAVPEASSIGSGSFSRCALQHRSTRLSTLYAQGSEEHGRPAGHRTACTRAVQQSLQGALPPPLASAGAPAGLCICASAALPPDHHYTYDALLGLIASLTARSLPDRRWQPEAGSMAEEYATPVAGG
jgi:hypothetical protein